MGNEKISLSMNVKSRINNTQFIIVNFLLALPWEVLLDDVLYDGDCFIIFSFSFWSPLGGFLADSFNGSKK